MNIIKLKNNFNIFKNKDKNGKDYYLIQTLNNLKFYAFGTNFFGYDKLTQNWDTCTKIEVEYEQVKNSSKVLTFKDLSDPCSLCKLKCILLSKKSTE